METKDDRLCRSQLVELKSSTPEDTYQEILHRLPEELQGLTVSFLGGDTVKSLSAKLETRQWEVRYKIKRSLSLLQGGIRAHIAMKDLLQEGESRSQSFDLNQPIKEAGLEISVRADRILEEKGCQVVGDITLSAIADISTKTRRDIAWEMVRIGRLEFKQFL